MAMVTISIISNDGVRSRLRLALGDRVVTRKMADRLALVVNMALTLKNPTLCISKYRVETHGFL